MMQRQRSLAFLLGFALTLSLLSCQATPVTNSGVPVTSEALATAARAVHVAELVVTTAADSLTAGYKAGVIPASTLQHFQATVAPRVTAALATAKVAMKTAAAAPDSTPMTLVLTAVLELQKEAADLQGWFASNAMIIQGVLK